MCPQQVKQGDYPLPPTEMYMCVCLLWYCKVNFVVPVITGRVLPWIAKYTSSMVLVSFPEAIFNDTSCLN